LSSRFVVGVLVRKIIPPSVEEFLDPDVRRFGRNRLRRAGLESRKQLRQIALGSEEGLPR
jgi:hypothetical protein